VCGNGAVESAEACDDGNATNGDGCSTMCQLELGCAAGQTAVVLKATDLPKLVLDNTAPGTVSVVNVTATGATGKVVVVLGTITHQFAGDLDVSLISPMGTVIDLTSDNGGTGDDYVSTILDDMATSAVTAGTSPMRGRFRPEALLTTLNGEPAAGAWTLRVADDANIDIGELVSWTLGICVQ
jgi:cysteine-rich repeat protein